MNEDPLTDETPWHFPNTNRVNGFAPGDRVAIVNCELAGAYGKVELSVHGCGLSSCHCHLVRVDMMSKPDVEEEWVRSLSVNGNARWFRVSEVTHVD